MSFMHATECSQCLLIGPDHFGTYDPVFTDRCPIHGTGEEATSDDRLEALDAPATRWPVWIDARFHFVCGLVTGFAGGALVVLAVLGV